MVVRGRAEKLEGNESILYISDLHAETWLQGAVKAWDHACLELAMQRGCTVSPP
jgi:hypothetical protein